MSVYKKKRSFKILITVLTILMLFMLSLSAATAPELEETKDALESADYSVNVYGVNTEEKLKEYLKDHTSDFAESNVEITGVNILSFTPAITDTEDGSFSFTVELLYKNYRITTDKIDGVIFCEPVSVTAVSSSNTVSEGESLTVSAEISDYDGGDIMWFESSSKNKLGTQLKETSKTLNITPDSGTKYYYFSYKGTTSNAVTVTVLKPFVPVDDIVLKDFSFICGVPSVLDAIVYPENSSVSDIVWDVSSGDAFISLNKITAKQSGVITIEAKIKGGAENGGDYVKFFELYADENEDVTSLVSWDAYPMSPETITAVSFVSGGVKNVQITTLSDMTTNKTLESTDISNKSVLATAHIVGDDVTDAESVKLHLKGNLANRQVNVVSVDAQGNIECTNAVVSDKGALDVPAGKVSYIITSQYNEKSNFLFLFDLIPIVPLLLIPVFVGIGKKEPS